MQITIFQKMFVFRILRYPTCDGWCTQTE